MRHILQRLSNRLGAALRHARSPSSTPAEADKAWGDCIDDKQCGAKTGEFTYRPETGQEIKTATRLG